MSSSPRVLNYAELDPEFHAKIRDWLEADLPEGWFSGDLTTPHEQREQFRFRRPDTIGGGTSEIQGNLIAQHALGLSAMNKRSVLPRSELINYSVDSLPGSYATSRCRCARSDQSMTPTDPNDAAAPSSQPIRTDKNIQETP